MFISVKKYMELLSRIEALEKKTMELEHRTKIYNFDFGTDTDLYKLCRELPRFVDKRAEAVLDNRLKKLSEH